jgi:hypothetical protein
MNKETEISKTLDTVQDNDKLSICINVTKEHPNKIVRMILYESGKSCYDKGLEESLEMENAYVEEDIREQFFKNISQSQIIEFFQKARTMNEGEYCLITSISYLRYINNTTDIIDDDTVREIWNVLKILLLKTRVNIEEKLKLEEDTNGRPNI